MRNVGCLVFLSLFSVSAFSQKAEDKSYPKLTADEIVSRHLASIGKPEAIAAVKSRIMTGTGTFASKIQPGKVGGPAQFASDGDMVLLAMVFNANNYPYERFAFDGKDLTTAALPGGGLSPLGTFLKSNKLVVKRGLFGGVLREAWPLLKADKDVKLESAGIAKFGDRSLYKLKYSTSGIGEMSVTLYFDPETFRHVRTEYFYRTGQVTSPNPNRVQPEGTVPSSYTVTEEFSDFAKVDDLVLPLTYVVEYESDAGKALIWTINFTQAVNDQSLDASAFKVS